MYIQHHSCIYIDNQIPNIYSNYIDKIQKTKKKKQQFSLHFVCFVGEFLRMWFVRPAINRINCNFHSLWKILPTNYMYKIKKNYDNFLCLLSIREFFLFYTMLHWYTWCSNTRLYESFCDLLGPAINHTNCRERWPDGRVQDQGIHQWTIGYLLLAPFNSVVSSLRPLVTAPSFAMIKIQMPSAILR